MKAHNTHKDNKNRGVICIVIQKYQNNKMLSTTGENNYHPFHMITQVVNNTEQIQHLHVRTSLAIITHVLRCIITLVCFFAPLKGSRLIHT